MAKAYTHRYRNIRGIAESMLALNRHLAKRFDLPLIITTEIPASPADNGVETLLCPKQAAAVLGISVKTLANWRSRGTTGLVYVQVGKRILYRSSDLRAFIASGAKMSTSETGGRA